MIGVEHNIGRIAEQLRARSEGVNERLRRGLLQIGIAIERGASKNLSGQGAPGAYPVPRRTGNLARGLSGPIVAGRSVTVRNTAAYAGAIHEGFQAYGNPNAPRYPGRPYLQDAAAEVDAPAILVEALEAAP